MENYKGAMMKPLVEISAKEGGFIGAGAAPAVHLDQSSERFRLNLRSLANDLPTENMTELTRQQVTDLLAASEMKVDARLANFDVSIKSGFADLTLAMAKQSAAIDKQTDSMRVEMAQIRTEMAKQTGEMRTEMSNVRGDALKGTIEVTRWVVGFGIATLMAIFAMSRTDKPAAAPAAPPAPVVIYAQPAATAAPPTTAPPAKP